MIHKTKQPISCLMITQPDRIDDMQRSMACFNSQTFKDRELVIVHDGGDAYHNKIKHIASGMPGADISIYKEMPGHQLGWLRNRSLVHARHPLVCQWDDDDLYHPERLMHQHAKLVEEDADFCFLTDQLHLFTGKNYLFWDDWSVEAWPGNLIQGTLLGRKNMMPEYPEIPVGEDTELTRQIVDRGSSIAVLSGSGWLYIYRYTGSNAWDFTHHAAISHWKRLSGQALEKQINTLETELRRYPHPVSGVTMPHEHGSYTLSL